MQNKMNWFGITGSISIFTVIVVSIFVPWWQVSVGSVDSPLANFQVSPMSNNFSFLGQTFTFPLIMAINISVIISLLAGGIAILVSSINPKKSYANKLLTFSYRKPIYALLIFVIGLFITIVLTKSVTGLDVPMIGSANSAVDGSIIQSLLGDISISNVLFTAGFQWPFYLVIVSAILCIIANYYDKRILSATAVT